MKKEDLQAYRELIQEYKQKQREIKEAEHGIQDLRWIRFLDQEKNDLHHELKSLADKIGLDPSQVNIDILAGHGDCNEYGLPEFSLLETDSAVVNPHYSVWEDGDFHHVSENDKELLKDLMAFDAFIPFGIQTAWHLFDHDQFFDIEPADEEKRRRALKLLKTGICDMRFLEIESQKTFHQAVKIFGIAVKKCDVEKLLGFIAAHRELFSIDQRFFNQEMLAEYWDSLLDQVITDVSEYARTEYEMQCKRQNRGYYETKSGLLNSFLNSLLYRGSLTREQKESAEKKLQKEIKLAEVEEQMRETERYENPFTEFEDQHELEPFWMRKK